LGGILGVSSTKIYEFFGEFKIFVSGKFSWLVIEILYSIIAINGVRIYESNRYNPILS